MNENEDRSKIEQRFFVVVVQYLVKCQTAAG